MAVAIIIKASVIMFFQKDYWQEVADRFVKENVTVTPNRGHILSSDGKLMASSLPEYRIYMDFLAGGAKKDSLLFKVHINEVCEGLSRILPDRSPAQFKRILDEGRRKKARNFLIYPKRISYIQYKQIKERPIFNKNKYA